MILEEIEGEGSIVVDVWFLFYSILRLLTSPSFSDSYEFIDSLSIQNNWMHRTQMTHSIL